MIRTIVFTGLALFTLTRMLVAADDHAKPLFNGKDLSGWEGDPAVWSVDDGAIVGRTTAEAPIENNTFLIWKDGKVGDFRLRFEYRIDGGNSGVQYRSHIDDPAKWIVGGYQADIDSQPVYSGILYEERGRGILAKRGERVKINVDGKPESKSFADSAELQKSVHSDNWNQYEIEAVGPRLRHTINGKLMSETIDRDSKKRSKSGVLALQVHAGPPMKVQFRNIKLEKLDAGRRSSRRADNASNSQSQ